MSWKSIIINFMAIIQKIIYTFFSSFLNRSITGIRSNCNLPPLLLLLAIFKHICLTNFYDEYNPPLNTVQLMVSKFLMFHENLELLPSVYCYDLYPGNNNLLKYTTLVLFGIPVRNQPDWLEATKEDWLWGTNASSIFLQSVQNVWHPLRFF